jgi:hypothetical protein
MTLIDFLDVLDLIAKEYGSFILGALTLLFTIIIRRQAISEIRQTQNR